MGNLLLIYKLLKTKNSYGISLASQICLLAATLSRCVWFTDTKLPSMYISWAELFMALALHIALIYLCLKHKDDFAKKPPVYLSAKVLLSVAFVLSLVLHPGKKGKYFFTQQMFVSFTMYSEALSLLPQLYHMQQHKSIEGLAASYIGVLCIARFSRIFFWWSMSNKVSQFWYLIAADVVHTLMTTFFAVRYKLYGRVYNSQSELAFTSRPQEKHD